MSEQEPDPFDPLPYRSRADDRRDSAWAPAPLQITVAFFATIIALTVMVFIGFAVGNGPGGGVLLLAIGTVATLVTGSRFQQKENTRYTALGIWIGLGCSILAEGLCFAAMG